MAEMVEMYSTTWCPDCIRARLVLKRLKVAFVEIDIERDKAGYDRVMAHNHGQRIVPTIFFPDGSALVEPSNQALTERVTALGLVAEKE
jgi:glutaredoxin